MVDMNGESSDKGELVFQEKPVPIVTHLTSSRASTNKYTQGVKIFQEER